MIYHSLTDVDRPVLARGILQVIKVYCSQRSACGQDIHRLLRLKNVCELVAPEEAEFGICGEDEQLNCQHIIRVPLHDTSPEQAFRSILNSIRGHV